MLSTLRLACTCNRPVHLTLEVGSLEAVVSASCSGVRNSWTPKEFWQGNLQVNISLQLHESGKTGALKLQVSTAGLKEWGVVGPINVQLQINEEDNISFTFQMTR